MGSEVATEIPKNHATFTFEEIETITQSAPQLSSSHSPEREVIGVSTDSRTVEPGNLFIALVGERFDGHDYLERAFALGASAALVQHDITSCTAQPCFRIRDTRVGLGKLAQAHRERWRGTLIAVGGSVGKTTTRRAISSVLRAHTDKSSVHETLANFNNAVGVPMTLLGLSETHRYAVAELGTNTRGEMKWLSEIVRPDIGLLTRISIEHAEGLGSLQDIADEESRLFEHSKQIVLNADDSQICDVAARFKPLISYGLKGDIRLLSATMIDERGMKIQVTAKGTAYELRVPILGEQGIYVALAAFASAHACLSNVDIEKVNEGLASLSRVQDGRMNIRHTAEGAIVIDDTYNANPASMHAAIASASELARLRRRRLVLILGKMGELGAYERQEHIALLDHISNAAPTHVILIGGVYQELAEQLRALSISDVRLVESSDEAAPYATRVVSANNVVLVKGSRSVKSEKVVAQLLSGEGGVVRGRVDPSKELL